jgi:hypothetical protein
MRAYRVAYGGDPQGIDGFVHWWRDGTFLGLYIRQSLAERGSQLTLGHEIGHLYVDLAANKHTSMPGGIVSVNMERSTGLHIRGVWKGCCL